MRATVFRLVILTVVALALVAGSGRPARAFHRYIDVDLTNQAATAIEGGEPVYTAPVSTGKPGFETATGTYRIWRRVFNETMDSATVGIPRNAPEGYYLTDILYTQYFTFDGAALHSNYWQPASVFGNRPTSHGCVGMLEEDAAFFWEFADIGTPVVIHY